MKRHDQQRHQRVQPAPAGEPDGRRAGQQRQARHGIVEGVQVSRLEAGVALELVLAPGAQGQGGGQVQGQPQAAEHQHPAGAYGRRGLQPVPGLHHDAGGQRQQHAGAQERVEHLQAVPAVGEAVARLAPVGHQEAGQAQQVGHQVVEVLQAVGNQAQRSGPEAAEPLDQRADPEDGRTPAQGAPACPGHGHGHGHGGGREVLGWRRRAGA